VERKQSRSFEFILTKRSSKNFAASLKKPEKAKHFMLIKKKAFKLYLKGSYRKPYTHLNT